MLGCCCPRCALNIFLFSPLDLCFHFAVEMRHLISLFLHLHTAYVIWTPAISCRENDIYISSDRAAVICAFAEISCRRHSGCAVCE
jgi:hypothetical protein